MISTRRGRKSSQTRAIKPTHHTQAQMKEILLQIVAEVEDVRSIVALRVPRLLSTFDSLKAKKSAIEARRPFYDELRGKIEKLSL